MKQRLLFIVLLGLLSSTKTIAQNNAYLTQLAKDIITLRQKKVSKTALNQTVLNWSEAGKPKITLMDDIGHSDGEFRGDGANRFKMNQLVTFVYDRQNHKMVSKGEFFNSTEKGVFYSAIEKTVQKGDTVNYTLTGHIGAQEFAFIPFNAKAKYQVTVNGKTAKPDVDGITWIRLSPAEIKDKISISLTYLATNSAKHESFTFLNYNSQK